MATSAISNTSEVAEDFEVVARLKGAPGFRISDSVAIDSVVRTTASGGSWVLNLERNAGITPWGTWWEITEKISVANGGDRVYAAASGSGDANLQASRITPIGTRATSLAAYVTQETGDARYARIGAGASEFAAIVTDAPYLADNTGVTDASTAINAAIAAVKAAGGGLVYLPAGTYKIAAPLTLSVMSGVTISGAGRHATILEPTTALAGVSVIKFTNCRKPQVRDMTIHGNTTSPPSAAVESVSSAPPGGETGTPTNLTVVNCCIGSTGALSSFTSGVKWTPTSDSNNDLGHIERVEFRNMINGLQIEGENSLEHAVIDCNFNNLVTPVKVTGGSFNMVGGQIGGITGYCFDFFAGTYHHACTINGLATELQAAGGWFRMAAGAAVPVYVSASEFSGGEPSTTVLSHAGGSIFSATACRFATGQVATNATFSNSGSSAYFVGCNMAFPTITYNGRLVMLANYHDPGTVTLTNSGSGTLVKMANRGGSLDNEADLAVRRVILELATNYGQIVWKDGANEKWWLYQNSGDASLYLRDLVNAREHAKYTPGASSAAAITKFSSKLLAVGGVGVGNSAAGSSLGTVVKKMQVFDETGASLGYVPIYDAIT